MSGQPQTRNTNHTSTHFLTNQTICRLLISDRIDQLCEYYSFVFLVTLLLVLLFPSTSLPYIKSTNSCCFSGDLQWYPIVDISHQILQLQRGYTFTKFSFLCNVLSYFDIPDDHYQIKPWLKRVMRFGVLRISVFWGYSVSWQVVRFLENQHIKSVPASAELYVVSGLRYRYPFRLLTRHVANPKTETEPNVLDSLHS